MSPCKDGPNRVSRSHHVWIQRNVFEMLSNGRFAALTCIWQNRQDLERIKEKSRSVPRSCRIHVTENWGSLRWIKGLTCYVQRKTLGWHTWEHIKKDSLMRQKRFGAWKGRGIHKDWRKERSINKARTETYRGKHKENTVTLTRRAGEEHRV